MKNLFLLIIITVVLPMGFVSCDDGFLDRYPKEELSDGSYWKTPKDAEMFVGDVYRQILPGKNHGDIGSDTESENSVYGIKWAASKISKGIYDPADMGWKTEYTAIRACNVLLSKIDEIPNYNQTDKEATIGEARFLRAYTYFTLIRSFGDVPYTDSPLELTKLKGITRTPVAEVYKKIMEDLDYAASKLPLKWPASQYGRATQGAAQSIKARAALYFKHYDTAANAAKAVIESGEYELFDKDNTGRYAELFWEQQEACNEVIMARIFKAPEMTHYLMMWHTFPTKGWGGINPTQSLVDAFECIDGAPIDKSPLYDPIDPFKNRDPRLEVNVLHDGEEMFGVTIKVAPLKSSGPTGIAQHGDATATGYYHQKFLDPNINPQTTGKVMGKDWHVIRFAEALLTYAEAKNELSGPDPTAFEAVNRVRRRVGLPDLQNTDPSKPTYCANQDALRQRIRNEWRVEFAQEGGMRQWDIRRWGIAKEVLNAPFLGLKYTLVGTGDNQTCILYQGENVKLAGSSYEDHNYLYPIPQTEIDLNPALTQNPEY